MAESEGTDFSIQALQDRAQGGADANAEIDLEEDEPDFKMAGDDDDDYDFM